MHKNSIIAKLIKIIQKSKYRESIVCYVYRLCQKLNMHYVGLIIDGSTNEGTTPKMNYFNFQVFSKYELFQ